MIGAPNTQGQKYWLGIVQWAPETSVSEEIADNFRNYNIDMNNIAPSNFKAILYADDKNLLSPMCSFSSSNSLNPTNLTEVTNSINDELPHMHEWLLINKLSVNVSKTTFMIFHHQQRRIDTLIPDLKLDSEPIEHVSEFNFLGLG